MRGYGYNERTIGSGAAPLPEGRGSFRGGTGRALT